MDGEILEFLLRFYGVICFFLKGQTESIANFKERLKTYNLKHFR